MDDLSIEYINSFYDRNLLIHGDRPEAFRWTPKGQLLRYEGMLAIADSIENRKILDFGCGKGDFNQFLKERNANVDYTGFDINEKFIAMAKEKHPESVFRVFDLDKNILDEDFDYIFICGVFNLKVQGIDETIRVILKKLFDHCRIALAFNALSIHTPQKDFELHYVSPEDVFTFAIKELSPFVSLRHDRIPHDFTMFVYRRDQLPAYSVEN